MRRIWPSVGQDELDQLAREILSVEQKVFLVHGPMGAGKTTLIRSLCKALGIIDRVNSPTYALVHEYQTELGDSVFHFDLYRIQSPGELIELGLEEYLDSGKYCLIEWPEKAGDLLKRPKADIFIAPIDALRRHISLNDEQISL